MIKFRFPLHIHLSTLFVLMTVLISAVIATVGYRMSYDMLAASADEESHRASREIASEIRSIINPANTSIAILSHDPLMAARTFSARWQRVSVLQTALNNAAAMSAVYCGYDNGDFFMLTKLDTPELRQRLNAPERARYQLRSIEGGVGKFVYLSAALGVLREESHPEYASSYDPRKRDWYRLGSAAASTITTRPYLFYALAKVGLSVAKHSAGGASVVSADVPLEALGDVLRQQRVTPSSRSVLVDRSGTVIASEDMQAVIAAPDDPHAVAGLKHIESFGISALRGIAGQLPDADTPNGLSRTVAVPGDGKWRVAALPITLEGNEPLYLLLAIPERELFATALNIREASIAITVLIVLLSIPLISLVAHAISGSIRRLSTEADAIRHFEFDSHLQVRSVITEVNSLAETMDVMKQAIRKFMSITHAVAAEPDFETLLALLLKDIMGVSHAAAGALYLVENDTLMPGLAYASNGDEIGANLAAIPIAEVPQLIREALAQHTAISGELSAADYQRHGLDTLSTARNALVAVVVPLINRQQQLLGVILLQRTTPIHSAQLAFAGAVADSASSSLETRGLIRDQKALFEAFVQLIAGAIDAKSAYTGGHCARVPELTKMLAQAACDAEEGPYADFQLSEEEWEAVHVGAWLHDCGKVTTPEYVVDKATKLETIYDRIHEVRMRFEVLKRDAEIACLKAIAAGTPAVEAQTQMEQVQTQLDADFAFVAECNLGGEFMAPDKVERLKAIATRTWLRTLDDRLGIAHEALRRKSQQADAQLPVVEPLLADKPEHRIERNASERLTADNRWGFKLKVPELLYNRGELYNLLVSRGTLSEEERYKINEHIVQSIIMLSALPFPRHLKNVPEIAGGHHEKMDGSGYPKQLKREDMSPVARMMAIADIFEALTAADRPYKKAKSLSESIRIMSAMMRDQHIDPELFALFLRSGVYRDYAVRHMAPELIDAVDIEAALSI